jgi:N-hydroxyarylamine O-acetyltransferase
MAPPDRPEGARSHMLLRVDLPEGAFLADVGFGGHLLDAPLRLMADIEQPTAMGLWRLAGDEGRLTLQLRLGDGWQDIYRFTLEPQLAADYQVANWFTATHPASLFRNNLLMERLLPGRRVSLFNTRLVERSAEGEKRERALTGAEDLAAVLRHQFGIEISASAEEIWSRIACRT